MTPAYYAIALTALLVVLYFSRDIRLPALPALPAVPASLQKESPGARHAVSDVTETRQWARERDALDEWRDRQLTRKGLAEMTESGHWQQTQAAAL